MTDDAISATVNHLRELVAERDKEIDELKAEVDRLKDGIAAYEVERREFIGKLSKVKDYIGDDAWDLLEEKDTA